MYEISGDIFALRIDLRINDQMLDLASIQEGKNYVKYLRLMNRIRIPPSINLTKKFGTIRGSQNRR